MASLAGGRVCGMAADISADGSGTDRPHSPPVTVTFTQPISDDSGTCTAGVPVI